VTERAGGSILTFSGVTFWPLDPRPEDIAIEDIAHALSNLCRFTGHTRRFYSVGEHSVRVSEALEGTGFELWGLLHDASEAYLGDVARPTKYAVDGFGDAYRAAEYRLHRCVADRFGLSFPEPAMVKAIDNRMLRAEQRDLMPVSADELLAPDELAWPETIEPWTSEWAKIRFVGRFRQLTAAVRDAA
jgi:hypothetical protein